MKLIYFLFTFFLACLTTQAQNPQTIDEIKKICAQAKHDTTCVLLLKNKALEYSRTEPDKCIEIGEKALQISEKINFEKGKGWGILP